jgi:hypothetical protein
MQWFMCGGMSLVHLKIARRDLSEVAGFNYQKCEKDAFKRPRLIINFYFDFSM